MRLIAIASLFMSFSALACPDLSGTYKTCIDNGKLSTVDNVVTVSTVNGVASFSMTSTDAETGERTTDVLVADGQTKLNVESDEYATYTDKTTTVCEGNTVKVVTSFIIETQGTRQESPAIHLTLTKSGNKLVGTTNGNILVADDGSMTLDPSQASNLVCE